MKKARPLLLLLAAILLAYCTTPSPVVPATANAVTPQYTATPSLQPSRTATQTPRATDLPTFTPTLTWTPLPTLSSPEASAKIAELLETNGGCELPCWWGITPGKTPWSVASHFLSPFVFEIEQGRNQIYNENGKKHTYTLFQFYYEIPGEVQPARVELGVKDDIVDHMNIYPPAAEHKFQLHQLLAVLGPPKQILMSAQSSSPIRELPPTVLVLDYDDEGVWASYGYIPTRIGENLSICPQPWRQTVLSSENLGGILVLFDPKIEDPRAGSFEHFADIVGGFTAKKLEDVTDMTTETFYATFLDPNSEVCLETPAELWP